MKSGPGQAVWRRGGLLVTSTSKDEGKVQNVFKGFVEELGQMRWSKQLEE